MVQGRPPSDSKVTLAGKQGQGDTRAVKVVRDQSLSVKHLRFMVMTQCHDGVMASHVGRDATIELAQRHYWWPSMRNWIAGEIGMNSSRGDCDLISRRTNRAFCDVCPRCTRYKCPFLGVSAGG